MQSVLDFRPKKQNKGNTTATKATRALDQESGNDSDRRAQSVAQNKEQEQPTRKRQKLDECDPTKKKAYVARKKRFVLKKLMQMPFDIICETLGHLDPLDLLNLSRTTKSFRAMLMSRSTSISIWRTSLAGVKGLPACPPDLSEPAFVCLMFGNDCDVCRIEEPLRFRSLNRDYRIRVKICSWCLLDECEKPSGKFVGEKNTLFKESAGYPVQLWPYRPTFWIEYGNKQHWLYAAPSGLDARWAQEYNDAADKDKWVEDKLDEVKSAATYQAECLAWFKEYIESQIAVGCCFDGPKFTETTRNKRMRVVDDGFGGLIEYKPRRSTR